MADPAFSSALQELTGMPDPLAFKRVSPLVRGGGVFKEEPVATEPADRTYEPPVDIPLPELPNYEEIIAEPTRLLSQTQQEHETFLGEKEADTAKRVAAQARRKLTAAQKYRTDLQAEEVRKERDAFEAQLAKPFLPTQQNFADLATMYSLIGVLGFAIGSSGRNSAIQAMSAMNGMIEGYREGRIDLYEKEKDAFESNAKALQTKINSLNNKIKEIAELAKVDYEKADLEADVMFAEEGAEFLKNYKDKIGLVGTIKMLQEKVKAGEKLFEFMTKERTRVEEINKKARDRFEENVRNIEAKREDAGKMAELRTWLANQADVTRRELASDREALSRDLARDQENLRRDIAAAEDKRQRELQAEREKDRAEREKDKREFEAREAEKDRQFKALMAQQDRNHRSALAALRSEGKVGLKPGARITEGYVADNQLITDLSYMKTQLKDPELVGFLKKYQVEGFLSEEAKFLDQALSKDLPPKLRKFLTTVRDVRNNYYLNISGKAVTGGEALRNYGTVPQPGDTADRMIDKIDGMERRVGQKIVLTQRLYPALPSLQGAAQPGQRTILQPGQDYSRDLPESSSMPSPKPMPTGQRLKDYTRAHPEFGGSEERAKEFLRTQGYQ